MKTIETTANVSEEGLITLQVPPDVPRGVCRVVVTIETRDSGSPVRKPFVFPVDDYGPWPEDLSLRREDMYGDDGR